MKLFIYTRIKPFLKIDQIRWTNNKKREITLRWDDLEVGWC